MMRCRIKDVPIPNKNLFIVRPVLSELGSTFGTEDFDIGERIKGVVGL